MRTSAQALRDAIASGAVEAWNRGERIQLATFSTNEWVDFDVKSDCLPEFTATIWHWRPAPTKRRIPFTRESCPKNALWRYCGGSIWITVQYYSADGIRLNNEEFKTWEQLASGWYYSIDGGETWHPAYIP